MEDPALGEKPSQNVGVTGYDLDALAEAVAWHETKNCTLGTGWTHNNAFGIMTWENGYREPKYYDTCEESYQDFKKLWAENYKDFPNIQLAKKYSGNDRANIWLRNVKEKYSELVSS